MRAHKNKIKFIKTTSVSLVALIAISETANAAKLFDSQGASRADSRAHIASTQTVKINRGALNQATLDFNLDGEAVTAIRSRQILGAKGNVTWIGHLQGSPAESVIITARGNVFSGVIQSASGSYEISGAKAGLQSLEKIDLDALPEEDLGMSEDALSHVSPVTTQDASTLPDLIQQDIMVVYTQDACDQAANQTNSDCAQLEADIVTTFAQMNQAYLDSDINIQSNLTSMRLLNYTETSSMPISQLQNTSDGILDEVHPWREEDGADLVHMIQKNSGCGVAYTTINAAYGFAVTAEACMLGNRTFAHETGHNQNALHDRKQHSGGTVGGYRYGFRRCNDNSDEDQGAPYFRTVMAYSCSGAPRVGIFSNPNRSDFAGVPQGIDPDVDPEKGAYNARRINETALAVSEYRTRVVTPTTPPAAPSGLIASQNGFDAVNLTWADNADNEDGFTIERSLDGVNFSEIVSLGVNQTSHTDNGLSPETTYYYRVEANNSAGASGWSNVASATTEAAPSSVDHVASSETATSGTVTGLLSATHSDDGVVQTITEQGSSGPRRRKTQFYSHSYNFNVSGGVGGVLVSTNAWVSGSEGAEFAYSVNGGAWTSMFFVTSNDTANMQTFMLPDGISGNVSIRVTDATQSEGEAVDSVSIDSLVITSFTIGGSVPAAPSGLNVTETTSSSVALAFTDNSSDEFGFEVWRSTSAGACGSTMVGTVAADQGSFKDMTASPSTIYFYDVSAYNGSGSSGCAGEVSATTDAGPAITASGAGSKVKGAQQVALTWSGATGSTVDIERNGVVVQTVANTGSYTDPIGSKGGGSYDYRVCEAGSDTVCSASFTITF